ncbi:PAS domain S-box-containing protein [Granulicella pectinivorans]|uniref:histidine kinase n=1 Tax=Granulicella pectinivorans TaxID=474950 RepID=A0A1I6M690_9BACT|nr:PAS domain S-box protein [Granulicella pectinivorans]SFS11206.1 PAS domain S-box-containing protein [Granulicella pectinivorans]
MNALQEKDELKRIDALEEYEVLGATPDAALDDIVRLAGQLCNAPLALIALVGPDRLYFRSVIGAEISDAPRGNLPFEDVLLSNDVYEISDARLDPAYRNGIAFAGRSFRFFAGAPLVTPAGAVIGSLSVMDSANRRLTNAQVTSLAALARQAINQLELNNRIRQMDRAAHARVRAESALTVERNFVSAVLDTVGALVVVYDTAGRIVRFNRACETASGYDFPSLVGRYPWERLIPESDISTAIDAFERLRNGEFPATFENKWVSRDGSERLIDWCATALLDPQGQVAFIIATGIDVTVQRAAESTLRESEARYRQLVEGSLGMVCTHDLDGVLLSVNTHGAQSIGRTVEDMVGRSLGDLMIPGKQALLEPYLQQIEETGEAQGLLYLSHVNGEHRVIAYRNKLIDVPGHEPYVLGFGVDISEQVKAEDKLRVLIRQSNSILESVGDGIYGIDLEGKVTVINPAAAQMLGYKPQELLGKVFHDVVHHTRPDGTPYPEEECPVRRTLINRDTIRVANEVFWRKDGTSFPVEYVARPQIESNKDSGREGKAVGVVVAFTDTTERRALDRMKDEFVSTVSHELRTPLTSLRAALGLIAGGALQNRPDKLQHMLEIAIGNTDRLVRLVNDILDLERIGSGQAELHYTMCSVDDLLRRAAGLQQTAAAKSSIAISFDAAGVNVWADPDRVLQTLTNLISNAIKFSPAGSAIRLSARNLDEAEVEIQVEDHGRGIPEDKLEQIFERFQQVDASDSRAMGGTGLGLAICRSIVHQHGGRIWATSRLGEGATFHFTLPTRPANNLR